MTQVRCNRVLLIEDNPADVFLVREAIRCRPIDCDLEVVETFEGAMDVVKSGSIPDIHAILIDLNLRTGSGLDVLNVVRSTRRTEEGADRDSHLIRLAAGSRCSDATWRRFVYPQAQRS